MADDDEIAAYEKAERERVRKIRRVAGLAWAGVGIALVFLGLFVRQDLMFVAVGLVALGIAARYALTTPMNPG